LTRAFVHPAGNVSRGNPNNSGDGKDSKTTNLSRSKPALTEFSKATHSIQLFQHALQEWSPSCRLPVTPACTFGGTCVTSPSISQGALKAHSSGADFTLCNMLQLDESIPGRSPVGEPTRKCCRPIACRLLHRRTRLSLTESDYLICPCLS